nr:acyltransferase [Bacteriovorax sp. HI3]
MILLIKRLKQKLLYQFYYKAILGKSGKKVSLFEPIRIDGGEYISLGDFVSIQSNGWLYAKNTSNTNAVLSIGEGTVLGYNNHITAIKSVKIGKMVLTANNVFITDNYHAHEDHLTPIMLQEVKFKGDVEIGDGSWLGENVCVMGVKIGKNCVIGANSVVTKDIPDYSIAVGSPARIIKQYSEVEKQWKAIPR